MSNYTKLTDFAAKDALLTGNPNKLVKGTEIDNEFDAIETAIATKIDTTTSTDNAVPRFDGTGGQVQNSTVVIDDSGNLGVGVTPSTWSGSGIKAVQVAGDAAVWSNGSQFTCLSTNEYYNGTNAVYKDTGYVTRYNQTAGQHIWYNAPSGTASNIISFTQAMTLDASGNLSIGETSVGWGERLRVTKSVSDGAALAIFSNGGTVSCFMNYGSQSGWNAGSTAMAIGRVSATSRSINAGGSINASGADYAEYEYNNGLSIQKGAVVGFKSDGTLTLTFSEAVRFGIKSTDPSYVGGDTWGSVDAIGHRPTNEEDLAAWEEKLETARKLVDRIAYSGKVPCNVYGASAGGYIIAKEDIDGVITGEFVADPDFTQYKKAVGRVNKVLDDGRCEVAVIVH